MGRPWAAGGPPWLHPGPQQRRLRPSSAASTRRHGTRAPQAAKSGDADLIPPPRPKRPKTEVSGDGASTGARSGGQQRRSSGSSGREDMLLDAAVPPEQQAAVATMLARAYEFLGALFDGSASPGAGSLGSFEEVGAGRVAVGSRWSCERGRE